MVPPPGCCWKINLTVMNDPKRKYWVINPTNQHNWTVALATMPEISKYGFSLTDYDDDCPLEELAKLKTKYEKIKSYKHVLKDTHELILKPTYFNGMYSVKFD